MIYRRKMTLLMFLDELYIQYINFQVSSFCSYSDRRASIDRWADGQQGSKTARQT